MPFGHSALTVLTLLLLAGCTHESAASAELGKTCTLGFDAGMLTTDYNPQAPECSSSLCLKPVYTTSSAEADNTAPYCTTTCSGDDDCHGQERDRDDPDDRRCRGGYVCGVLFTVGPLCCQKLCLCRDFLPQQNVTTPDICLPGAKVSCSSL